MISTNDYSNTKDKAIALGASASFKSSVNAKSVEISNPRLLSDGYTKSDLSSLGISVNGLTKDVLNFVKTTTEYSINVTQAEFSKTIKIIAVPHSSHASTHLHMVAKHSIHDACFDSHLTS